MGVGVTTGRGVGRGGRINYLKSQISSKSSVPLTRTSCRASRRVEGGVSEALTEHVTTPPPQTA